MENRPKSMIKEGNRVTNTSSNTCVPDNVVDGIDATSSCSFFKSNLSFDRNVLLEDKDRTPCITSL